jgi:hypothetical protein
MCSEALSELSTTFVLGFKAQVAVALHLRGRVLLNYLREMVNPEVNRLTYFLRDLGVSGTQRLVARIFHEVWQANKTKNEWLVDQLMPLFVRAVLDYPWAKDDLQFSKFIDPMCQLGLWHYFDLPKRGPVRNLVRLTEDYYTARWLPFINLGPEPAKRVVCWSNDFQDSSEWDYEQFDDPNNDFEEEEDIQEPEDQNYTSNEWLLAILRGMAHGTADRRYPEVLAMGFRLLYKYTDSEKPYGLYRIEIWGYLALALAGLDLHGPDTVFYCVERMLECCRSLSDKCHYLATVTRARELLHLSTQISFDDAAGDPQVPKLSEQFVEIVFAHIRALFRKVEDLMLGFVREYLLHSKCLDNANCYIKRVEIRRIITATMDELLGLIGNRDLWAYWHEDVVNRLRNYKLVIDLMELMVSNMERRENFSMAELKEAAQRLAEFSGQRVDWPTFHVYCDMALPWVTNHDAIAFPARLTNLCRTIETLVGYQHSRTEADAKTSALILFVFCRDLSIPERPRNIRIVLSPLLVHSVLYIFERVPVSVSTATEFRKSVLLSIKSLLFNEHLRHSETKRKDVFWSFWRMSDLCFVSAIGYKNLTLVDREKLRLADFERAHYHKSLGERKELNRRGDNAVEVEKGEQERDLKLLHLIRTSTNGLVDAARGFGWQRLDSKRRF